MGSDYSTSKREKLNSEIAALKDTIYVLDNHETVPMVSISDHAERISNLFPMQSPDKCFPIHQLLLVGPLTKTDIPLDILEILIEHFDVNEFNNVRMTCLNIAIENEHYSAVRYLVKQGADCNKATHGFKITDRMTPIALLAQKSNAPLELFDLLQTPQTLNDDSCWHLPLHEAVDCGHSEAALHLIQLGASVDKGRISGLPIDYYAKRITHQIDEKLFEKLVPSDTINILRSIGRILRDENTKCGFEVRFKMFHYLVQQLNQIDSLSVSNIFSWSGHRQMDINKQVLLTEQHSCKCMYLMSLLLLHLDWNIVSIPEPIDVHGSIPEQDLLCVHAINEIWNSYRLKPKVKSLLTLCIQQTRKHMHSLTTTSFMSLPVPSYIKRLLKYTDIADVFCEAFRLWPECSPILR